jgi:hypothetical protein
LLLLLLLLWLLRLERAILLRPARATALAPQVGVGPGEHDAKISKTCKGKMVLDRKCYAALEDGCDSRSTYAWLRINDEAWPHRMLERCGSSGNQVTGTSG